MMQDSMEGFNPTKRLTAAIAANTAFLVFEVVFGIIAGSLALLGDAGHNFSDSFALVLSLIAVRVMTRPATERKTFGYHRMGIVVAFINSLIITLICFFLFYGAINRLIEPVDVKGGMVMIVAGIGFLVNGSVALLMRGGRSDLNLRSAFLHLLTDALVSLGVVISGAIVLATGWTYADPLITMVIAVLILVSAFQIMRESVHILMESVPRGVDYGDIVNDIMAMPGVTGVHDLHIWEIGSRQYSLTAHILVDDAPVSEYQELLRKIKGMLLTEHDVIHTALELKTERCSPEEECRFAEP
ncbi:MAG: cation transporter [Actinobacteria bacterium]|nr:cation transporter [Actinomycetota bacterium]